MKEKSYLTGIIGALLGGFIATIPWVLMYVYGGMILSLLAIIIALGALKGYQLFNGKVDNKLPFIIAVISVLAVTVSTFVIIPYLLILKEEANVSISYLYSNSQFMSALVKDYIISLLFTFLGIGGIIKSIKIQVNDNKEKINVPLFNNNKVPQEDIESVKNIFAKYNAFDKNNTIGKDVLLKDMMQENKEEIFNNLFLQGYLKKSGDSYYFVQNNTKTKKITAVVLLIVILVSFALVILFAFLGSSDNNSNGSFNNSYISYNYDKTWVLYPSEDQKDYYVLVPKIDETGYSGIISVSNSDTTLLKKDYETMKKSVIDSFEEEKEKIKTTDLTTPNGYSVLLVEIEYEDPKCLDKLYYILDDNKYAVVYSTDYYNEKVKNIDEVTMEVVNSFLFK